MQKQVKIIFSMFVLFYFMALPAMAAQKALLIGVDGVQLERLLAVSHPNFNRLNMAKAYTGGIVGEGSEQSTISGSGWATILTGVWEQKHFIATNEAGEANPAFPSIFKRLKGANSRLKIGSFADWSAINKQFFTSDVALIDQVQSGLSDVDATNAAINFINADGDFTFVHLDDADEAGHSYGFGSQYDAALVSIDQKVGQLLDAVEKKQNQTGDDWLILVVTDHGREASGYNHGGQSQSEKTSFIATNKRLNAEYSTVVTTISNMSLNGLYGYPAVTSIAPTVLNHMGVALQAEWQLDGVSLIGELGVRKVMKGITSTLDWFAQGEGNVAIYNANTSQLLAQVPAGNMAWSDPSLGSNSIDYLLTFNGVSTNYRANRRPLGFTSVVSWNADTAYFFRDDGRYVRYNKPKDKADESFPLDVNNKDWQGLSAYRFQLNAGFNAETGKAYFFLNDGRYISYDIASDKIDDGFPKQIDETNWPGLAPYASSIRAALMWKSAKKKVFLFLSDGSYLRINLTNFTIDAGFPKVVNNNFWPGLGDYATDITSAVKWDDSRAYFFLTNHRYIRYSITHDASDSGYPKAVDNGTWPGILDP